MEDEPTLPRLPAVSWNEQTQTFSTSRKRSRRDNAPPLFSNSSDPAVFSSDDDPALDNYVQGRRKKRYIGAWFSQNPTSSDSTVEDEPQYRLAPRSRRTLERQFDSGVWMGGEETDVDVDKEEERGAWTRNQGKLRERRAFHRVPSLRISKTEALAREVIRQCVEDGREDVDLSGMRLDSLSNATIEALSGFSYIPLVAEGVSFEQRRPSLKLYLARNELTRLPGAIFNLECLTVLSISRNQLTDIPPAIGRLKSLVELNLSTNYLNCLPYELLELITGSSKLRSLNLHPNPFFQPDEDAAPVLSQRDSSQSASPDAQAEGSDHKISPRRAVFSARSPVQFLDSKGKTYSDFRLEAVAEGETRVCVHKPGEELVQSLRDPMRSKSQPASIVHNASRVPTLLELSLQACYKSSDLSNAPEMLPESAPTYLHQHLQEALVQREAGGRTCSMCSRPLIIPRAIWIEWWQLEGPEAAPRSGERESRSEERVVPFARRGCCWVCVPSDAQATPRRLAGT